jgi:hypothetical protein
MYGVGESKIVAVIRLPYADCEFFANFLQAKLLFHGF